MHSELGAPISCASFAPVGVSPFTARVCGIGRHIDGEHPQEFAVGVEYLNAPVGAVADIDIVVAVDRDRVRQIELPGRRSFVPQDFTQSPACHISPRAN